MTCGAFDYAGVLWRDGGRRRTTQCRTPRFDLEASFRRSGPEIRPQGA